MLSRIVRPMNLRRKPCRTSYEHPKVCPENVFRYQLNIPWPYMYFNWILFTFYLVTFSSSLKIGLSHLPPFSTLSARLIYISPPYCFKSYFHRIEGRPLAYLPIYNLNFNTVFAHLSSLNLAICPVKFHFCSATASAMPLIPIICFVQVLRFRCLIDIPSICLPIAL